MFLSSRSSRHPGPPPWFVLFFVLCALLGLGYLGLKVWAVASGRVPAWVLFVNDVALPWVGAFHA